jgi:hypothetical protein
MPLAFQALWEAEIRKNLVKKKKIVRPHLNRKKAGCGGVYLSSQ